MKLNFGRYPNDRISVRVTDDDGAPLLTLTTNVPSAVLPDPNYAIIKTWGENASEWRRVIDTFPDVFIPTDLKYNDSPIYLVFSNDLTSAIRGTRELIVTQFSQLVSQIDCEFDDSDLQTMFVTYMAGYVGGAAAFSDNGPEAVMMAIPEMTTDRPFINLTTLRAHIAEHKENP